MRRMLPRREIHDDDLPALVVEDLDAAPVAGPPQRPSWVQAAALALATLGVGALVVVAWEQRDQDRLARHQACLVDAQTRGMLENQVGGPGGPFDPAALANCLHRRSAKAVQTIQRVRNTDYAAFILSRSASPASPRSQEGVAAEP
jgi:hypothetical protein